LSDTDWRVSFEYSGFDLCQKNVENARRLFSGNEFSRSGTFSKSPLLPNLSIFVLFMICSNTSSLAGLEQALGEICRVHSARNVPRFFQMDEIPEHVVRAARGLLLEPAEPGSGERAFGEPRLFTAQAIHLGLVSGPSYGLSVHT
jgi:hypothetical protein